MLEQGLPGRRRYQGQIAKVTLRRAENLKPKGFAI
jgi:hypothetical protein